MLRIRLVIFYNLSTNPRKTQSPLVCQSSNTSPKQTMYWFWAGASAVSELVPSFKGQFAFLQA